MTQACAGKKRQSLQLGQRSYFVMHDDDVNEDDDDDNANNEEGLYIFWDDQHFYLLHRLLYP